MEDCEPKTGYHRSLRNEIFRCETGSESNGVLAYTEASGTDYYTGYRCGFHEDDLPRSWGGPMRGYDAVYKATNIFHFNLLK